MSKEKRLALKACHSTRYKTMWSVDYDYLKKLSIEEIRWLADFSRLFYHGSPNKVEGRRITKKLRSESYTRNNIAERDLYTKTQLVSIERADRIADYYCEDLLIALLDRDTN